MPGLMQVMIFDLGFGSQELIPATLHKVSQVAGLAEERHPELAVEVEGGMHEATVGEATAAGAHRGRRRLGRLRPLSPGLPSRLARGSGNTLRRWPGRQRHRPAAPGLDTP